MGWKVSRWVHWVVCHSPRLVDLHKDHACLESISHLRQAFPSISLRGMPSTSTSSPLSPPNVATLSSSSTFDIATRGGKFPAPTHVRWVLPTCLTFRPLTLASCCTCPVAGAKRGAPVRRTLERFFRFCCTPCREGAGGGVQDSEGETYYTSEVICCQGSVSRCLLLVPY